MRRLLVLASLMFVFGLFATVLGLAPLHASETATLCVPDVRPNSAILQGTAFYDMSGNSSLDPGEPGLPGAQLALTQGATTYTTTSGDGARVSFTGVVPGFYSFTEITPPVGYQLADPMTIMIL